MYYNVYGIKLQLNFIIIFDIWQLIWYKLNNINLMTGKSKSYIRSIRELTVGES